MTDLLVLSNSRILPEKDNGSSVAGFLKAESLFIKSITCIDCESPLEM